MALPLTSIREDPPPNDTSVPFNETEVARASDDPDTLSTLHLTGMDRSYLEVGSLVSMDDVIIMSTPKDIPNDVFSNHLFLHEPPQKAATKLKQAKTPAAISSSAWRKFYEEKENVKAEKRAAILKRKQDRAEAAKQKKLKKDVKPQARTPSARNKKTNKKVLKELCTECKDVLISDAEEDEDKNVGCDFCQRWYHLKCTTFVGSSYVDILDKSFKCNVCIADQD